jgi:hypothetical protein
MAKKKKVVRRVWTATDVRELESLAKKRAGVAKISKALKRTICATAAKAHQLGVSLDTLGSKIGKDVCRSWMERTTA